MGFPSAKQYLDSFINYEIHLHKVSAEQFSLGRIMHLLNLLGNPQEHYKIIHVAGSKGKGSTSVITATMLDQAGFRVGLYTSPHLYDFKERIRVLKKPYRSKSKDEIFLDTIQSKELTKLVNQIKPFVDQVHREKDYGKLTYFEILTALALLYFKQRKVDFVVLETGLGGRLDATNAVQSDIAVLAPISLEHTHILGKTIAKIAQEKAGIIKDREQVVVIAPQTKQAAGVFSQRCQRFAIKPQLVKKIKIKTNLLGEHQQVNLSTALTVIDCLRKKGYDIPVSKVKKAAQNVFWPGRLEIVQKHPLMILDGAHNVDSVEKLMASLKKIIRNKKVFLIFSAAQDKDVMGMLKKLKTISKEVVFAEMNHPRSFQFKSGVIMDVPTAVKFASTHTRKDDVILVTGSLFLVSEVRKLCIN